MDGRATLHVHNGQLPLFRVGIVLEQLCQHGFGTRSLLQFVEDRLAPFGNMPMLCAQSAYVSANVRNDLANRGVLAGNRGSADAVLGIHRDDGEGGGDVGQCGILPVLEAAGCVFAVQGTRKHQAQGHGTPPKKATAGCF